MADEPPRSRARAILSLRCPQCREGRVFRGRFAMNERCPSCGLQFQRDEGYFLGAMYFSYLLGTVIIASLMLAVYFVLPHWYLYQIFLLSWALFLPFVPVVFRYSRVLWIHADRYIDPSSADDRDLGPRRDPPK